MFSFIMLSHSRLLRCSSTSSFFLSQNARTQWHTIESFTQPSSYVLTSFQWITTVFSPCTHKNQVIANNSIFTYEADGRSMLGPLYTFNIIDNNYETPAIYLPCRCGCSIYWEQCSINETDYSILISTYWYLYIERVVGFHWYAILISIQQESKNFTVCSPTQKLNFPKFLRIMVVFCVSHVQTCTTLGMTLVLSSLNSNFASRKITWLLFQFTPLIANGSLPWTGPKSVKPWARWLQHLKPLISNRSAHNILKDLEK